MKVFTKIWERRGYSQGFLNAAPVSVDTGQVRNALGVPAPPQICKELIGKRSIQHSPPARNRKTSASQWRNIVPRQFLRLGTGSGGSRSYCATGALPGMVDGMKRILPNAFRATVVLAALFPAFVLGGCTRTCLASVWICKISYSRVLLTDFEGRYISEYIAQGPVSRCGDGYQFTAVQRRIFTPFKLTFRYPLGRPVSVQGSHILISPTPRPAWL